ncbi:MAG: penicillin-binding protein 2 [Gammaproteobacteria bacterium]|jgi:penicillin-binding protein 2
MRTDQDLISNVNDLRRLKRRSSFLFFFAFLLIAVALYKIIELTVLDRQEYFTESEKNRIINVPIYPARGLIKLSNGEIIAENIVTHDLSIKKSLFNQSSTEINDLQRILLETGLEIQSNVSQITNGSDELILISGLSSEQLAKFQMNKEKWPSIELQTRLRRFLPHKNVFSHVVGHLGEVTKEDKRRNQDTKYKAGSYLGKVGLEKRYESEMRGKRGVSVIEVDVFGNQIREIERTQPERPLNLFLSLNLRLQTLARQELSGRKGAIIAIDPNTGFIKALVSSPDYNPNILNKTENGFPYPKEKQKDAPLFNRVISGSYPPASTIKPFLGLLGLEEGEIDVSTIINDEGVFQINGEGRKYRGWKEEGHGEVNLHKAIVESSDVYFYELASKLTIDKISDFLSLFNFGKNTGIDLINESSSVLPDRNWKLGNIGEAWFVGDTVNMGIGQGYIAVTPLQLASSVSAIATKGKIFKPKLVKRLGEQVIEPELLFSIELNKKENWDAIEKSMIAVVNSWNGTAHNLYKEGGIKIAGKTGTAQIKSLVDQDLTVKEEYEGIREIEKNRDHALFVSYGPLPNPNLTVVVIVENGESGSSVAAPIAMKLMEQYQKEMLVDV